MAKKKRAAPSVDCPKCGASMHPRSKACPKCGAVRVVGNGKPKAKGPGPAIAPSIAKVEAMESKLKYDAAILAARIGDAKLRDAINKAANDPVFAFLGSCGSAGEALRIVDGVIKDLHPTPEESESKKGSK